MVASFPKEEFDTHALPLAPSATLGTTGNDGFGQLHKEHLP
jgi:hypothetical protein